MARFFQTSSLALLLVVALTLGFTDAHPIAGSIQPRGNRVPTSTPGPTPNPSVHE
ncbi:hypothetical protein Pst134EA_009618 [Puccinia striiformis f. sp. tritici]|nr:hypothetical protein Pst134EA_009618 [Puccinia striiformis f. sp. tritici]KAH9469093.1 hypothetical protein Pst134EA_009618 [Puccinia striiformis f. sp. tritici]